MHSFVLRDFARSISTYGILIQLCSSPYLHAHINWASYYINKSVNRVFILSLLKDQYCTRNCKCFLESQIMRCLAKEIMSVGGRKNH